LVGRGRGTLSCGRSRYARRRKKPFDRRARVKRKKKAIVIGKIKKIASREGEKETFGGTQFTEKKKEAELFKKLTAWGREKNLCAMNTRKKPGVWDGREKKGETPGFFGDTQREESPSGEDKALNAEKKVEPLKMGKKKILTSTHA